MMIMYDDELPVGNKDDLLICRRNELVPENPDVQKTGIEGLLEYCLNKNIRHPDCIYKRYDEEEHKYVGKSKTAEYFTKLYGIDPSETGSSNTIFNCGAFLKRFFEGMSYEHRSDMAHALHDLEYLFDGNERLRKKLDKLADYHHCLANLMPAPVGFNASSAYDGKGRCDRDNDMPDIYYKRAKKDFPDMYLWINENMDRYSLQFFTEYESYCEDGHAQEPVSDDPVELIPFEWSVDNAIACIEWRAMKLFNRYQKRIGR